MDQPLRIPKYKKGDIVLCTYHGINIKSVIIDITEFNLERTLSIPGYIYEIQPIFIKGKIYSSFHEQFLKLIFEYKDRWGDWLNEQSN
jgi:hypothetical protein